MNDTNIIHQTIKKLEGTRNTKDALSLQLEDLKYGNDSTGVPSVWISFLIKSKQEKQPKLIKDINNFSSEFKETLLKSGLDAWPYVNFH